MFCIKICFLEQGQAFIGGAGAEFFTWSRSQSRKKYLEPEPRKNGSAPQHWV